MKKLMLFFCCFLLAISAFSQKPAKIGTSKYLEEKRGFKNIRLGSEVASILDDLRESKDTTLGIMPGVKFYEVVNSETLKVGSNIEIKKIIVGVFDAKIAIVSGYLKKGDGLIMKETFTQAYGNSTQTNQFMDKFTWYSKGVFLVLDNEGLREDSFLMVDRDLNDRIDELGKERAKKSVSDI